MKTRLGGIGKYWGQARYFVINLDDFAVSQYYHFALRLT
jgi:hypothetical protein